MIRLCHLRHIRRAMHAHAAERTYSARFNERRFNNGVNFVSNVLSSSWRTPGFAFEVPMLEVPC